MTNEEQQWLLSLSLLSLLGPTVDIDALTTQGFYKKPDAVKEPFAADITIDGHGQEELIRSYLDDFSIESRETYYEKMDACISGKGFSANVQRLLQIGRAMNDAERRRRQSFVVNGYPFLYDFFEEVMVYEVYWPREGLKAYDLSNAIMLLRLGSDLGYLDTATQQSYFERILPIAKRVFDTYKKFGCDAAIGRDIHCSYLKQIGSGLVTAIQKDVLAMAYYCVWQHLEDRT